MGPTSTRSPTAPRANAFVEHIELQPIDRQTNGPQLFYGLRYHTHIVKPGEVETFHDQVGYWLWEPATNTVTFTLGIPRGQVLLAGGTAEPDATEFELRAEVGSEVYGILSNPFLDQAFRTLSYRMHVTVDADGTWSYEEEGVLDIPDRDRALLPHRPQHPDPGGAGRAQPLGPGPCRRRKPRHRHSTKRKQDTAVNHLMRELAPITDDAWAQIDAEASRSLKHYLAARRLVDFSGPLGWEHSAVDVGRVDTMDSGPLGAVEAARRTVMPLIEVRLRLLAGQVGAGRRRPGGHRPRPGRGRSPPGGPRHWPRTIWSSTGTSRGPCPASWPPPHTSR